MNDSEFEVCSEALSRFLENFFSQFGFKELKLEKCLFASKFKETSAKISKLQVSSLSSFEASASRMTPYQEADEQGNSIKIVKLRRLMRYHRYGRLPRQFERIKCLIRSIRRRFQSLKSKPSQWTC